MSQRNCLIVSVFVVSIMALSGVLFAQRLIDLHRAWGDIRVLGDDADDWSGYAVAYGDINGDSYMDIIIGAPWADPGGRIDAGNVYVILGSSNPPQTIDLNSQPSDLTIYGDDADDQCGGAVASGDINGDGCDDILVGAALADPIGGENAGEIYIIFGSSSLPSTIDLSTQSADITVYGDDYHDYCGRAVASDDVNGDGYDDIIIGAWLAGPFGRSEAGETYVIFGSSFISPPYTIDLNTQLADICVYGDDNRDYSGRALASGDVNNDGYYDIIIGAYGADPPGGNKAGETYVILGSSSPASIIDLNSQSADITIYGDDYGDESGWAVGSGDINGDGFDDIIIGAPLADPGGRSEAGKTYVIFGSDSPPTTIDLDTQSADITVYGDAGGAGYAVASGDVNGDGCDDIIIGAHRASVGYRYGVGKTYVVFGFNPLYPDIIDLDYQSAVITVYGDDDGDYSGWAVTSGDVNGDGYDDLIIGAPYAEPSGKRYAGETYLISGGSAIIAARGIGGTLRAYIESFSFLGRKWGRFNTFGTGNSEGEVHLAVGDLDWDGLDEIAAGQGEGGTSCVKLLEVNGTLIESFKAFGPANTKGEVHLAIGNFASTSIDKEIAVAHGEGGKSWIKVFNAYGTFIRIFKAFGPANTKGEVHLAAGDLNDDGYDEIIAGMGEGGSSWVKIFSHEGSFIIKFKAFGPDGNSGGEVHLAVGNFDADTSVELAVATGYNGGNWVKLFENDGTFISKFKPFDAGDNPNGEVHITAADIDNDGICEIICGHGEGGSSLVKLFKADGTFIRSFIAFDSGNPQGEVHLGKVNY